MTVYNIKASRFFCFFKNTHKHTRIFLNNMGSVSYPKNITIIQIINRITFSNGYNLCYMYCQFAFMYSHFSPFRELSSIFKNSKLCDHETKI